MNCPFCGGEPRLTQFGNLYCVECVSVKCLCRTRLAAGDGKVWAEWNKRSASSPDASISPCPCCGGKPVQRVTQDTAQWHYVECSSCGLRHLGTKTKTEAIQKWQVRHG